MPASRARRGANPALRALAARLVSPAPIRNSLRAMARRHWLPEPVVLHIPLRGRVPIDLLDGPPFAMEADPRNLSVRRLFFQGDEGHEAETLRMFAALVDSADVFVDVGANLGIFSLLGATRNRALQVYAFEPNPSVFGLLVRNVDANRLRARIHVFAQAVSDAGGSVSFRVPRSPFGAHGHFTEFDDSEEDADNLIEVTAVTLDEALAGTSVDIIKIDVEGAEALVIEGARTILSESQPAVIVEVLEGRGIDRLEQALQSLDYHFYWLTGDGPVASESLVPDPTRRQRNYLCLPNGRTP